MDLLRHFVIGLGLPDPVDGKRRSSFERFTRLSGVFVVAVSQDVVLIQDPGHTGFSSHIERRRWRVKRVKIGSDLRRGCSKSLEILRNQSGLLVIGA